MLSIIVWVSFAVLPIMFVFDQPYIFMGALWTWAALFVTGVILTRRDAKSRRDLGQSAFGVSEIAATVCSLVGVLVTVPVAKFVIAIVTTPVLL